VPVPSNTNTLATSDSKKESTVEPQPHTPSTRSTLSATAPEYNGKILSKSDLSPPLPEDKQDILLFDSSDEQDYIEVERYLTQEIGYSIKLLISKTISSEYKNSQSLNNPKEPIYYYCPTENLNDIFKLLRCQNEQKQLIKPLIVYSNIRDAHEATELNIENNQFCLLRLNLFQSNILHKNSLQLTDPSTICFDRMWIYAYNDQEIL